MIRPPLPSDNELRAYWRIWKDEQWAAGKAPRLTFHQWRRHWLADQPKHLAELRAMGVDAYLKSRQP